MKHLFSLLSFLLLTGFAWGQAPNIVFSNTYGGAGADQFTNILESNDGNFIVIGSMEEQGTKTMIKKISRAGEIIWKKSIDRNVDPNVALSSIAKLDDGNYVLAGSGYREIESGYSQAWIEKFDENGKTLFSTYLGGESIEEANSIVATPDSGFVVAGRTLSVDWLKTGAVTDQINGDIWVMKFDKKCNIVWSKRLEAPDDERSPTIHLSYDKKSFILDYILNNDAVGTNDATLFCLDLQGKVLWGKCFGGESRDYISSISATNDNGFVISGDKDYISPNGLDRIAWTQKITSNGTQSWSRLGHQYNKSAYFAHQNTDSSYYLFSDSSTYFLKIEKIDKYGITQWIKSIEIPGLFRPSIAVDRNDDFIISSNTIWHKRGVVGENHGGWDGIVFKVNKDGTFVWSKMIGGSYEDRLSTLLISKNDEYIMIGYTLSNNGDVWNCSGGADAWIVKLDTLSSKKTAVPIGNSLSLAKSIQVKDGYILLSTDYSNWPGPRGIDINLTKLDFEGNSVFSRSYGGSKDEYPIDLIETKNGNIVFTAYSYSSDGDVPSNKGSHDVWTCILDSLGNMKHSKTFGGLFPDSPGSLFETDDGGFFIYGMTDVEQFYRHFWLTKLNYQGDSLFSRKFTDHFISITKSSADEYCFLEATTYGLRSSTLNNDLEIIDKKEFQNRYDWSGIFNVITKSISTNDGGAVLLGSTIQHQIGIIGYNHGLNDAWVVKFDKNWNVEWSKLYGGSKDDFAQSIVQTDDGGYLLAVKFHKVVNVFHCELFRGA